MNAIGIAPHTGVIIEQISRLECIKPFVLVRSKFRDYYDIYSILKSGVDINQLIPAALEHSGYKLKTKGLMIMLTNGQLFRKDEQFKTLNPVYDVTSTDIQEYIKNLLMQNR